MLRRAQAELDVRELVSFDRVQAELRLGPNGALVHCMEHLAEHCDWLSERLAPLLASDTYLIFDCPGQAELLTAHDALPRVARALEGRACGVRLACLHLVDAHLCADAGKFLAALLLSLSAMLHLGLPHVNALSKVDLIESYGALPFDLSFYAAGGGDAARLADAVAAGGASVRHAKLARGLCEVAEDYGLVSFATLDVTDEASMRRVLALCDQANGAVFAGLAAAAARRGEAPAMPHAYSVSTGAAAWPSERLMDVAEKFMPLREAASAQPPEA